RRLGDASSAKSEDPALGRPRRTAIASTSRPARVRRGASIMLSFHRAFIEANSLLGWTIGTARPLPVPLGSDQLRLYGRAANGCDRSAPPSLRDWLARYPAREQRRWLFVPAEERRLRRLQPAREPGCEGS